MADEPLTADIARELLDYNPDTGVLTWRYRDARWFADGEPYPTWNTRFAGTIVGRKDSRGCIRCTVLYRGYLAHRIIWLMMTGEWPQGEIDHIDHDPSNNRWANLRVVSRTENQRNMAKHLTNTSGVTGVNWHKGRWRAFLNQKHLGYFDSFDEAVAARLAAQKARGYHPNHGAPANKKAPGDCAPGAN